MKKIYTISLVALLVALASCNKTDNPKSSTNTEFGIQTPHEHEMVSYTISVTKDEAETKVSVADNGSALWEEDDVIRVFNTNDEWDPAGYEAKMTSGAGEQSATFTFEAPEARNEGFFVVYGADATLTEGKLNIVLPSTVSKSAKPILAGYTASKDEIGAVDLKAVAAYMKVTLTDEADAVRFFAVNNPEEKLAGTILLGADGTLSTYASDAQVLVSNPDNVFYVNLLPGTLSQGYIIDVENDGAHMIKSVSYGAEKTLAVSSFGRITLPEFTPALALGIKTSYQPTPSNDYANDKAELTATLNLSNALKAAATFKGYTCNGTTQTAGAFTGLKPNSYAVSASYDFTCGDVTIPLVAAGTAYITGIPYSIPVNNKNGWTGNCSVSNNSIRLSCRENPTASYTVSCYIPSDLSNLSLVYETTAEERTVAGGTATIKMNNVSLDSFKLAGGFAHSASVKHNGTKEVGAANSMTFSMSISGSSGAATAYVLIKKVTLEY